MNFYKKSKKRKTILVKTILVIASADCSPDEAQALAQDLGVEVIRITQLITPYLLKI